jgi:hypothetical protein
VPSDERPMAGVKPVVLMPIGLGVGSEKRTRFLFRLEGVWVVAMSWSEWDALAAGFVGEIALDRRLLRRSEVGSAAESSMIGEGGSSMYLSSPSTIPSQSRYLRSKIGLSTSQSAICFFSCIDWQVVDCCGSFETVVLPGYPKVSNR